MRHRRVSAAGLSACLACRKRFAPVLAVANKSKTICKRGEKKEGKSFIDTITTSMRASAYSRPAPQRRLQIFKPHSAKCSGHPSRLEKTAISDETSAFFLAVGHKLLTRMPPDLKNTRQKIHMRSPQKCHFKQPKSSVEAV